VGYSSCSVGGELQSSQNVVQFYFLLLPQRSFNRQTWLRSFATCAITTIHVLRIVIAYYISQYIKDYRQLKVVAPQTHATLGRVYSRCQLLTWTTLHYVMHEATRPR
jgi:hypothetical protein